MKAELNDTKMKLTLFLTQETRTSDVHCLDLDAWTWTEMYIVLNTQ